MVPSSEGGFPNGSALKKNLPAMQENHVLSLGQEDPQKEEMATHSSILAWKIPQTEGCDGLQFTVLQRVRLDWVHIWKWIGVDSCICMVESLCHPPETVTTCQSAMKVRPHGHQAPLSMGFSRQECWSGLLFPSPGNLPHPGIKPKSPAL